VSAVFGATSDEIQDQVWSVVFTNTYVEPAAAVTPTFTASVVGRLVAGRLAP